MQHTMNLGKTVTVHRDSFAYISHPTITITPSGDWLAAFNHSRRRDPIMHPPGDPLYRTLTSRSTDGGETWLPPVFAPDFDWHGTECPGLATTSKGTILLSQLRFGWYPLPMAKQRRAAGEHISIALPDRGWTEDFSEGDWDRSLQTWARGYHGLYTHRSTDDGRTFKTVRMDCSPYRDGYTRTGVRLLSDGRLAYAVTEHHPPHNTFTYLFISEDDGVSWNAPIEICKDIELRFGEPDIAEIRPGEIYCVLRDSRMSGFLFGCRSADGGATWTKPDKTSMYGHPGQLTVMEDGRLLCTYGRRTAPFGIRAAVSYDGGQTWDSENEIIIRDDLPNGNLGYPTTVEYEPGKCFCIYYGEDSLGVTYVMGTYFAI